MKTNNEHNESFLKMLVNIPHSIWIAIMIDIYIWKGYLYYEDDELHVVGKNPRAKRLAESSSITKERLFRFNLALVAVTSGMVAGIGLHLYLAK